MGNLSVHDGDTLPDDTKVLHLDHVHDHLLLENGDRVERAKLLVVWDFRCFILYLKFWLILFNLNNIILIWNLWLSLIIEISDIITLNNIE